MFKKVVSMVMATACMMSFGLARSYATEEEKSPVKYVLTKESKDDGTVSIKVQMSNLTEEEQTVGSYQLMLNYEDAEIGEVTCLHEDEGTFEQKSGELGQLSIFGEEITVESTTKDIAQISFKNATKGKFSVEKALVNVGDVMSGEDKEFTAEVEGELNEEEAPKEETPKDDAASSEPSKEDTASSVVSSEVPKEEDTVSSMVSSAVSSEVSSTVSSEVSSEVSSAVSSAVSSTVSSAASSKVASAVSSDASAKVTSSATVKAESSEPESVEEEPEEVVEEVVYVTEGKSLGSASTGENNVGLAVFGALMMMSAACCAYVFQKKRD